MIKGIVLGTKKRTETYFTYEVLILEQNKKASVNVFKNKETSELGKDSLLELTKKDKYYNLSKIIKKYERKIEAKPKKANKENFKTADEYENDYDKKLDINMCFKKAVDICISYSSLDKGSIKSKTKELYNILQEVKQEMDVV